ncbi:MAG: hypothetical protein QM500_04400 [Methylococcales bacterium]
MMIKQLNYTIAMNETAHIFNPTDNSFDARLSSLKDILRAFQNVDYCTQQTSNEQMREQIGSIRDVNEAKKVIERSLNIAAQSFDKKETKRVTEENLLPPNDMKEFIVVKHQQEAAEKRSHQSESTSTQSKHQR